MYFRGIAALAALLLANQALGQFAPVSQKRYVFESIGEEFFLNTASDFEPFNSALTAASQNSSISPDSISGIGSAGPDPFFSINSATSYFKLIFNVESETGFAFNGSMITGPKFGSGLVHFSGPNGDVVNLVSSGGDWFKWNETGTVGPGQYSLEVFVSNSIGSDLSTFEFSLAVPVPAVLPVLAAPLLFSRRRR